MTAPIIVPVGHLFGPVHRPDGHDVMVGLGGTPEYLDDEFAVWWLARGLVGRMVSRGPPRRSSRWLQSSAGPRRPQSSMRCWRAVS